MNIAAIELWALRSVAVLGLLVAVFVKGCSYGGDKMEAKYKTRDAEALIALGVANAKNRLDETNRQNAVLVAEAVAGQAQVDLANYRKSHALRGALSGCVLNHPASSDTANACAGAGDSAAVAACKATRLLQPPGSRDPGEELDDLLAEADSINDSYGICLATRPAVASEAVSRETH